MSIGNQALRKPVLAWAIASLLSAMPGLTRTANSGQPALTDTFTHAILAEFGTATW